MSAKAETTAPAAAGPTPNCRANSGMAGATMPKPRATQNATSARTKVSRGSPRRLAGRGGTGPPCQGEPPGARPRARSRRVRGEPVRPSGSTSVQVPDGRPPQRYRAACSAPRTPRTPRRATPHGTTARASDLDRRRAGPPGGGRCGRPRGAAPQRGALPLAGRGDVHRRVDDHPGRPAGLGPAPLAADQRPVAGGAARRRVDGGDPPGRPGARLGRVAQRGRPGPAVRGRLPDRARRPGAHRGRGALAGGARRPGRTTPTAPSSSTSASRST